MEAPGRAGSVFLLTDYGDADGFAGVLRAVLARLAPGVTTVDLTHGIPPFDVRAGALALARAVPHLGPGVVLAVVDPGVGTARRALAVAVAVGGPGSGSGTGTGPRFLVGPDNGLLLPALDLLGGPRAAVDLGPGPAADPADPADPGPVTFAGRDVFAPAAAGLWSGVPLDALGPPLEPSSLVRLPPPHLVRSGGTLEAEVIWIDRFGNLQLAGGAPDADAVGLDGALVVLASGRTLPARRVRAFGLLDSRELGLLLDADGHLSLVYDRRPAATVLGVYVADIVILGSRT